MRLLVLLALVVAPLSAHPHNSSDVSSHRDEDLTQFHFCGETINTNRTYFVNPSFPNTDVTIANPCRTRVDLIGENVCQLRLDFQTFSLAQPADSSQCNTDSFRITGTTSASVPTICGENAGQHLYVDVDPTSRGLTLEIDTQNTATLFQRRWAIEVTQIQCDSVERAPKGCRQLYSTTSGTVKSFNFKDPPSTAADIGGTPPATNLQLHLANQNYRVCIEPQRGFCSIRWTPTPAISEGATGTFVMTGSFIGQAAAIGTTTGWIDAYTGTESDGVVPNPLVPCADYVIIPGGSYAAFNIGGDPPVKTSGQSDRYCGGYFPTVTSTSQPFGLHVKTDGDEPLTTETGNVGFSLRYRMLSTNCN